MGVGFDRGRWAGCDSAPREGGRWGTKRTGSLLLLVLVILRLVDASGAWSV